MPAAQCRQAGLEVGEWQVADLVDDQDLGVSQLLQAAFQPTLLGGSHQPADEFLQGQEQHRVAGFNCFDPQGNGQVGFPGTCARGRCARPRSRTPRQAAAAELQAPGSRDSAGESRAARSIGSELNTNACLD